MRGYTIILGNISLLTETSFSPLRMTPDQNNMRKYWCHDIIEIINGDPKFIKQPLLVLIRGASLTTHKQNKRKLVN